MKHLSIVLAAAALAFSADSALSNGANHSSSGSVAPAAHSSAAPPPAGVATHSGVVPHSPNGLPRNYSGPMAYHPTVTYRNGNKTLNYPAVGVSSAHHSARSNLSATSNVRSIQRGAGNSNSQQTAANLPNSKSHHAGAVNFNSKTRLDPNASARLRNWKGNISTPNQAQQNHWNNCHHHHDHGWWHNHCIAFIFWDWGWWGWWDGWWYPAWGYDPYSYYGYNEPIYGYGDLSPEQIVASVQLALQQQGYYQYAIDGEMGPQTRSALARYQRDRHMNITSGIDPATLNSLGIIH